MASTGTTRVQTKLLHFVLAFEAEHGQGPTYPECCEGLGLSAKSKSTIARHVALLREQGKVISGRGRRIVLAPSVGAIPVVLDDELKHQVLALAARAGTTPQAVIVECVRDKLLPQRSHSVSRETDKPSCAPSASTG